MSPFRLRRRPRPFDWERQVPELRRTVKPRGRRLSGVIPPRIDRGACPGGLVAVLVNSDGAVLESSAIEDLSEGLDLAALHGAAAVRAGGAAAVYDGDTGALLVLVVMGATLAFSSEPEKFN